MELSVFSRPISGDALFSVKPEDLLRIPAVEGPEGLSRRWQKNEREDREEWLSVHAKQLGQPLQLYLRGSWRAYKKIPVDTSPIFLNLKPDASTPGLVPLLEASDDSWRSCLAAPETCAGWIDLDTSLILLDTLLVGENLESAPGLRWELLYKVSFYRELSGGRESQGIGWISARSVERKLPEAAGLSGRDAVHARLSRLASGTVEPHPAENATVATEVKKDVLQKLFPGAEVPVKFSRWKSSTTGEHEFRIDLEWRLDYSIVNAENSGPESATLAQQGLLFGFGGIMPVLLDWEAGGILTYTHPLRKSETTTASSPIFRFEQFLVRAAPFSPFGMTLKWGMGWHLVNQRNKSYGFSSLVGAELATFLEGSNGFGYFKAGPVGNSEGFELPNLELQLGAGWRPFPEAGPRGLGIVLEYWNLQFKSNSTQADAHMNALSLGLRKTF